MNPDKQDELHETRRLYEEYVKLASEAQFAAEIPAESEPERSVSYPVGIVLDQRAVHALVG